MVCILDEYRSHRAQRTSDPAWEGDSTMRICGCYRRKITATPASATIVPATERNVGE